MWSPVGGAEKPGAFSLILDRPAPFIGLYSNARAINNAFRATKTAADFSLVIRLQSSNSISCPPPLPSPLPPITQSDE